MKLAEDLLNQFDCIPRYLRYKGEIFVPIFYKHECEFHTNSYWALFAKVTQIGFSTRKVLYAVSGTTLTNVLGKFYTLFHQYCRDKYISGEDWFGPKPFEIDFDNDKCTTGVTSDTQM